MKPGLHIGLFLASALVCRAGQRATVCTTDGTDLVLGQTTVAVPFYGKPVVLAGAKSVLAAIQLYDHAVRKGIQVSAIDVSRANYLDVTLVNGTHCLISWLEMGKGTDLSSQDLDSRLDHVVAILRVAPAGNVANIIISDSPPDHPLLPPTGDADARRAQTDLRSDPEFLPYTVSENEDLSKIAAIFGTSVDELKKANALGKNGQIVPGQKILIPFKLPRAKEEGSER